MRQGWTASDIRRRLMCAYQEHLAEMSAYRKAERKAKAGKK